MRDITIMIDADDVLWAFIKGLCCWLNKKHGTNVSEEDVTDWHVLQYFPSLTTDEVWEPTHCDEFWATVEARDGAIEYVKTLINEGFKVYICTASDYRTIKPKFDQGFKRLFPFITQDQIIITKNKGLVCGDILIDDGIHNLENWRFKKVLMTAPHNQSYDAEANGMRRVNSWREAYDAIHEYAREIIGDSKDESN